MKTHLILTCALGIFIALGSTAISAQEPFEQAAFAISPSQVETNRHAPKDYDAKFKQNDMAIVYMIGFQKVRVAAKSGNIYKVVYANNNVAYFRANAVYPYFDANKYENLVRDNDEVLSPFLDCYAKKHNIYPELVGDFGWRHDGMTVEEIKERLQLGTAKMVQLERDLKSQFPVRPNTYHQIERNPAILDEIVTNREEYEQCVIDRKESSKFDDSVWLMAHRDDIKKALKAVNEYDPATKISMRSDMNVALYAVSPKARNAWLKSASALDFKDAIDKLLQPLADALAKKLPTYFPQMDKYPSGTAADFALLKRALKNPARYKIFKSGLMQSAWQIDKNSLGIPNARYKNGVIYLRDTEADHPYCHATYVNIIQNYSGGGTYAASRSALVAEELVGCPAGAK